jgi:pimeloyl-ACP methyl ester carboxylesterase
MQIRMYGVSGPVVVVLHGGPGAIGYMAPVGRGLADSFRVLEPFQRGSRGEPLTVAQHISDLHGVVKSQCGPERPAIVDSSWGAMLALAYAAAHPD